MSKKFLDKTGVSLLWLKIKQKFLHNVSTQVADGDIVLFSGTGGAEAKSGGPLTNLVDTVAYNTSVKKLQSKKVGGTATDVVTAAKIVTDGGGATGISFNGAQYNPKDDGTVSLPSLVSKEDGVTAATTTANGETTYTVNRYGECATAAATATKEVTLTSGRLTLEKGARVTVKFAAPNTANSPKLKVGTLDAKSISYDGTVIGSGTNKGYLVGVREFVYDGTNWCMTSANDNTTASVISSTDIKNDTGTTSGLITGTRFTEGFNDRLAGSIIDSTVLETGTDEDAAVVSAKVLNDWLASKLNPIQTVIDTITGDDEDDVINKWNEVVTFLEGIDESEKLESLMATAGRRDVVFGTCSTAAATAAKAVTVSGRSDLHAGDMVAVKFTNTNTASNPTLKVGSTDAMPIVYGNTNIGTAADTLDYAGRANATILYMYNGAAYVWLGWSYEPESLTSNDIDAAVASAESNS